MKETIHGEFRTEDERVEAQEHLDELRNHRDWPKWQRTMRKAAKDLETTLAAIQKAGWPDARLYVVGNGHSLELIGEEPEGRHNNSGSYSILSDVTVESFPVRGLEVSGNSV